MIVDFTIDKFLRPNFHFLRALRYWNRENTKTGLSIKEKIRINSMPIGEAGSTVLFGKPFLFSHNQGFLHSIHEIFEQDIYNFRIEHERPYIIDCGANVGLSILYFKRLYPKAEIIAFEPDPTIFSLLNKNVQTLADSDGIEVHEKAIWHENTSLKFYAEGALAGSNMVDFSGKQDLMSVEAIDLRSLLHRRVDFLKIDIEGAENTVIFKIEEQLKHVDRLFLEYHGITGDSQNLGDILKLLTRSGFQYYIRVAGEVMHLPFIKEKPQPYNQQLNIFCFRNDQ